ncbi:MAG: bifunctional glutamine synthetase adenylyltransferase/deadenyltransferase, partial [Gammaproteobacteria bacterium]
MSALPTSLKRAGERAAAGLEFPSDDQRAAAAEVFALSDFASAAAQRQSDWLRAELASHGFAGPFTRAEVRQAAREALAEVDDMAALQRSLRILRQRFQLWLIWRHCLRIATLEETTSSCSALADVLIDEALSRLHGWLCASRGVPTGRESELPQSLSVIAMGKLGAEELNLSSDVDLMFCFAERGQTVSAEGAGKAGELNQQYFVRLGQQLIQALDPVTADGFVFRVDMRLRPYGGSGPLALDFEGVEDYYATQGRDWERYALIKARPCAGDRAGGRRLLEDLSPFVFRRYLDFGAIDALREMKARLVADRQHPDDVKLGPGGIRDAEFSVQMQQMIWGGRESDLRSPKLLDAIAALSAHGHLSEAQASGLAAGYRFLRDTEHSLQAEADRQTQRLPTDDTGRARLAACMGYENYAAYFRVLDRHRAAVGAVFDGMLGIPGEAPSQGRRLWQSPDHE